MLQSILNMSDSSSDSDKLILDIKQENCEDCPYNVIKVEPKEEDTGSHDNGEVIASAARTTPSPHASSHAVATGSIPGPSQLDQLLNQDLETSCK